MSDQSQGLKKALTVCREKNRQLTQSNIYLLKFWTENIMLLVQSDFPSVNQKVQELADNSYWINGDRVNVLTAIAYNNYPDDSFEDLIEALKGINPIIADEVKEHGINFTVLGNGDSFGASGFTNCDDIAVDTEEWYGDLPSDSLAETIWDNSEGDYDGEREKMEGSIEQFKVDLIAEINQYLENNGLDLDELNQFVLKDDIIQSPITINYVDEWGAISTNKGNLSWRSDDESIWEFIHANRGNLIGRSQIINPELLPGFLEGETVFAIQ